MTTDCNSPQGNLHRRSNGFWYVDLRVAGRRVRKSTGTTDHEEAKAYLARYASLLTPRLYDAAWIESVETDLTQRDSWVKKMHKNVQYRAKHTGRICTITRSDVIALLNRSNGRCEVSGIRFSWEKMEHSKCAPFAPSIDRINSRVGYVSENCRIVCLAVNIAMREWGESVMTKIGLAMLAKKIEQEI